MNRLGLETPKEDDAGLGCMARLPRADMGMLGWAEMRDQSLVSLVGCAQVGRRRTDLGVDGVDVVQVEGSEGMGPAGCTFSRLILLCAAYAGVLLLSFENSKGVSYFEKKAEKI